MEGMMGDIGGLSTLLSESREAEDRANRAGSGQQTQKPMALGATTVRLGGGAGGASAAAAAAAEAAAAVEEKKKKEAKLIWAVEDVPTEDMLACNVGDTRPCPRYELSYKQAVGTEDTFLGLAGKSPSSADCTHITIKIHFPGATMKDLDLDVTKNRIKAESKTHKLFTYLPVCVDKDKGQAKFDKAKEVLSVTLPIVEDE
jgi:hypothetical protein